MALFSIKLLPIHIKFVLDSIIGITQAYYGEQTPVVSYKANSIAYNAFTKTCEVMEVSPYDCDNEVEFLFEDGLCSYIVQSCAVLYDVASKIPNVSPATLQDHTNGATLAQAIAGLIMEATDFVDYPELKELWTGTDRKIVDSCLPFLRTYAQRMKQAGV